VDVEDPRPGAAATLGAAGDDPGLQATGAATPAEAEPDVVEPDVASDAATPAVVEPDVAPEPVPVEEAPATTDLAESAEPAVRRRSPLRRGLAVGAVAVVVALAVSAFASAGSAVGDVDQRFVDSTRSQGYTVDPGPQQALVVSAGHKICERKESHSTVAERRATALSTEELGAVADTFAGNTRAFTTLALKTFCGS
jgi:Protein of unknown function (DUF732)